MKKSILLFVLALSTYSFAQIKTNKEDIKNKVSTFEVWAFKKPFTTKECYFINYGQKNFKPNNYDLVGQGIFDKDDRKFEKGEWLQLNQYLEAQGYFKQEERRESIGTIEGRVITYKNKE